MAESIWGDYRVARLTEMWNAGIATPEIGRQLNVTKNACIGKAHRIGLQTHPNFKGTLKAWVPRAEPAWWSQLRDGGCTYDIGDEGALVFCGAATRHGSSFCAAHHTVVWHPPKLERIAAA